MIIALVGESASGKSTIERLIQERDSSFTRIISYTTRPIREGETNNVDYHFIDDEKFNHMLNKNMFLEHAQYRGWNYGSAKVDYMDGNNHVIVCTPHGFRLLKKWANGLRVHQKPPVEVYSIYFDVDRRSRMIKILERGDDIDEAYRRNISDVGQFDGFADEADYIIHNIKYKKDIETIYAEVVNIINGIKLVEREFHK